MKFLTAGNMIIYTDIKTGQRYFDTTMLQAILSISASKLKREMLKYGFVEDDYIKYNNRFLIKEMAVIDFMDYMASRWFKQYVKSTQENKK